MYVCFCFGMDRIESFIMQQQARSEGKAITQQNLAPEMFGLEIQALKLIVLS